MTALRYRRRHARYTVGAADRPGTVVEWWKADLNDVPAELRNQITFRFADDADQVLEEALGVATPAGVD